MSHAHTQRLGRTTLVAIGCGVACGVAGQATACVEPTPPMEPPPSWWAWGDTPGVDTLYVGLASVFPSSSPHDCSCGIGLGSTANPLPTIGIDIHGVRVGVLNKVTHEFTPILPFDEFGPSPTGSGAWQAGPPTGDPSLGGPVDGSTWFGFDGVVPPVDPPSLEADECFVICFDFWIDPGIDFVLDAQIGGGLGSPNGGPLFDPANPHSSRYSNSFNLRLPAPGTAACFGLGLVAAMRRRQE